LIEASLEATRKPTLKNPEGDVQIHPAMKQLTGNDKLTASQAADLIKRLLRLDPDTLEDLISSGVLEEAHRTALRLRPKSQHKSLKTREKE